MRIWPKAAVPALALAIVNAGLPVKITLSSHLPGIEGSLAVARGGNAGNGSSASRGGDNGNGGGSDGRGSGRGSGNNGGAGASQGKAGEKAKSDGSESADASSGADDADSAGSVGSPAAATALPGELSRQYFRFTASSRIHRNPVGARKQRTEARNIGRAGGVSSRRANAGAGRASGLPSRRAAATGNGGRPRFDDRALVAVGLSEADIGRLAAAGVGVVSRTSSSKSRVVKLGLLRGMSLDGARKLVARSNRNAVTYAEAYYYSYGGAADCADASCLATLVRWPFKACGASPLIGMIDTRIDTEHEALKGQDIETIELDKQPSMSNAEHGTAVAALLAGRERSIAPGLLPQAKIVSVAAFGSEDGVERADVIRLVAALQALSRRNVRVVNLSFSGPPNAVLEQAIREAIAEGMILVAAAGNGGAGAEPAYPAAYPGVIAVTAVDRDMRVYSRANRGDYIALAAPGVGIPMASESGGKAVRSGTSFAAPYVTAAVASLEAAAPTITASRAADLLASGARDLGAPGRDPVYGWGLMQASGLCDPPGAEPAMASRYPLSG
jgi:hypothetical protein